MRSQTSVYQWPCPLPPLLFFALLFPAACAESTKCLMVLNLFSRPGRPGNVPQKEMNFHPALCILIFYPKNTCICLQLHLLQTLSGTQIAGGCSDSADLGLGMMPLVPCVEHGVVAHCCWSWMELIQISCRCWSYNIISL